jgi:hypothetical protein
MYLLKINKREHELENSEWLINIDKNKNFYILEGNGELKQAREDQYKGLLCTAVQNIISFEKV